MMVREIVETDRPDWVRLRESINAVAILICRRHIAGEDRKIQSGRRI